MQNNAIEVGAWGRGAFWSLRMDKLQRLIDTAFGQPAAERAPQTPNEYTLERQRAFDERAKKIEALRRVRMAQQTN